MYTINLLQVPPYLRTSPFFLYLNVPDDQLDQFFFDIPDQCLKPDFQILNEHDLHHFLRTVCFWECCELIITSTDFLDFVFDQRNKKICLSSFPEYQFDLPELSTIRALMDEPPKQRISNATKLGSFALVRYFFNSYATDRSDCCVRVAGRLGHVDILRFFIENSRGIDDIICTAVSECNVEFLKTAIAAGARLKCAAATAAAKKGSFNCLWHLIANNCPINAESAAAAAKKGHLECLKLLFEVYQKGCSDWSDFFDYMRYVKPNVHDLACFKCVLSLRYECTAQTFANFVIHGRIDCALWMVRNGYDASFDPCNIAAQCGSVACLTALREANCEVPADICTVAASARKVDVLIYLYAEGISAGTEAITAAAEIGHFPCLKLLHEKGCPWDEATALAAGRSGIHYLRYVLTKGCPCAKTVANTNAMAAACDMRMLKFLHEMQFPWDVSTLVAIATGDENEMRLRLKYALESGCCCDGTLCSAVAATGNVASLTLLRELGCPLDNSAFVAAARGGHLPMIEYLRRSDCCWGQSSFEAAVAGGHLHCVEYMYTHNCPMDVMNAINVAAQHGHVNIIDYLRKQRFPWSSNTCAIAASGGRVEVLMFLHVGNCPWDEETCKRASTAECLQYAISNGCPGYDGYTSTVVRH